MNSICVLMDTKRHNGMYSCSRSAVSITLHTHTANYLRNRWLAFILLTYTTQLCLHSNRNHIHVSQNTPSAAVVVADVFKVEIKWLTASLNYNKLKTKLKADRSRTFSCCFNYRVSLCLYSKQR